MTQAFTTVVAALCTAVLRAHGREDSADVVRFVLAQHGRMPDYLRLPLLLATLGFDWSAVVFSGCRFHLATPAQQARQVQRWRDSRLTVCRDLIRFYESLAVFGWYCFHHGSQHDQTVSQPAARRPLAG